MKELSGRCKVWGVFPNSATEEEVFGLDKNNNFLSPSKWIYIVKGNFENMLRTSPGKEELMSLIWKW